MGPDFTHLEAKNYEFLQRFLDATKANLFFARGVILVEGDAENLLIPTIAEIIGRPLHRYGVSIVDVGSTAFLHYARIFHRKDTQCMGIKVAVVTDMDVKPLEWVDDEGKSPTLEEVDAGKRARLESLAELRGGDIEVFVSPNWTLEYELGMTCFREALYRSVLWAEKKENSKSGIPRDEKWSEVQKKAFKDIQDWMSEYESSARSTEEVAYEIYRKAMLAKHISKAVTAQVFADELLRDYTAQENGGSVLTRLRKEQSIKYLIDAICYVTEPLAEEKCDSDN